MKNGKYTEYQRIIGDRLSENNGKNYQFMMTIARRMLRNRQDAEDAVQESMIAILTTTSPYNPAEKFKPWAGRIVVNKCKDTLKSQRRNNSIQLSYEVKMPNNSALDYIEIFPDERSQDPLRAIASTETKEIIRKEICGLPEHFTICIINLMLEKSYSQISEEISVPLGTVKSRINVGRRMLRERLNERDIL